MRVINLLVCLLLMVGVWATNTSTTLWPQPHSFSYNSSGASVTVSPCNINFTINSPDKIYIQEIINIYQLQVFGCTTTTQGKVALTITSTNKGQFVATNLSHEKYTLNLPNTASWTLKSDYYVGFLRGFETFFQLFNLQSNGNYIVSGFPIAITDAPNYIWRGLMIDTSRHYLDVDTIKRIIDAMLYSKLNVLHWHIVDEDSFPMYVPNVPELSQYGNLGGTFSQTDIRTVIQYAQLRGIRVVPQIDTPAHTESWGRSQKYKNITLNCNGKYMGQFDPTLNLTMQVVQEVFTYVNNTFDDNYIHFGGDEVLYTCWDQKPSIMAYMNAHNISNYENLSIVYRQNQKAMFRSKISATKKAIYWANEDIDLPLQPDDAVEWWGDAANQTFLSGRPNEVILANFDQTYLDRGFNNIYGINYGVYITWRALYAYNPIIPNATVIGGETCMWGEICTKHTFDQKVLLKSSVLSERLWNVGLVLNNSTINNIATRLNAQTERLRARGYKIWPVSVELCENNMGNCF